MKNAVIIGVICFIAIVVAGAFFLLEPQESISQGEVSFEIVEKGQDSGSISERKNYRIKTVDELQELWRLTFGGDGAVLPVINFDENEVLAVYDGSHTSGGYDITVASVVDEPGVARHVTIVHTAPGEGCMTTQAFTSPFEIIVLPKSHLPIERVDTLETIDC